MRKKQLTLWVMAALTMAACSQHEELTQATGTQTVTVGVSMDNGMAARATDYDNDEAPTRCVLTVYDKATNQPVRSATDKNNADGFAFTVSLDPQKDYTFAFWADLGENHYDIPQAGQDDRLDMMLDLTKIELVEISGHLRPTIAYTGTLDVPGSALGSALNATLKHAVGKLTVRNTETAVLKGDRTLTLAYPTLNGFNALAGQAAGSSQTQTATYAIQSGAACPADADVLTVYTLTDGTPATVTLTLEGQPAEEVTNVPFAADRRILLQGAIGNIGLATSNVTAVPTESWGSEQTMDFPQNILVDAAAHTVTLRQPGLLTAEAIAAALGEGNTLTINGDMSQTDFYTLREATAIANLTLTDETELPTQAFFGMSALASVCLPKVTTVGGDAFHRSPVQSISLPEAVTIGNNAFRETTALTTIDLPKATSVGWYTFQEATALTNVNLPLVQSVGNYAFKGSAVQSISLPEVKSIGIGVFQDATSLATAMLPKATLVGLDAFSNTPALTSLTLTAAGSINIVNNFSSTAANIDLTLNADKQSAVQGGNTWNGQTWKSISFAQ